VFVQASVFVQARVFVQASVFVQANVFVQASVFVQGCVFVQASAFVTDNIKDTSLLRNLAICRKCFIVQAPELLHSGRPQPCSPWAEGSIYISPFRNVLEKNQVSGIHEVVARAKVAAQKTFQQSQLLQNKKKILFEGDPL
jgi:hypothetical protein